MQDLVRFQLSDCATWQPRQQPTMCIVNPPWGSRLLASSSPDSLWEGGSTADSQVPQGSQLAPVGEELQAAWQALRAFFKVSTFGVLLQEPGMLPSLVAGGGCMSWVGPQPWKLDAAVAGMRHPMKRNLSPVVGAVQRSSCATTRFRY